MKNSCLILTGCAVVGNMMLASAADRPNVIVIMTDQQRADLCGREGFPMEITPFVDRMAQQGMWFNKAYTAAPISSPARISMLTGRFPKATEVDSNHNTEDIKRTPDLFTIAKEQGYRTAMIGKNHTYLKPENVDFWDGYNHDGQANKNAKTPAGEAFDKELRKMQMYASLPAAEGGVEGQQPFRMVSDALDWIGSDSENPFVMWLSFPEPHNPYQVCEPYYSMFAPDKIPSTLTDERALKTLNPKYAHLKEMMLLGHKGYDVNLQRLRGNYMGMIRLIDDQIARLVESLEKSGVMDNTIIVVLADHGDYAGEYGLMKKGVGMSDMITRIPMVWFGAGIEKSAAVRADCVSIVDVLPTVCEIIGADIPVAVQGRSLWEMLQGHAYPTAEFESVMAEAGYGGQYYTKEDGTDYIAEGCVHKSGLFFDCLNTWTQSGSLRMIRKGDWKLVFDMEGNGELYDMAKDPVETNNLFGKRKYSDKQSELMGDLLKWEISTQDPLPTPRRRYIYKRYPHNYMFHAE